MMNKTVSSIFFLLVLIVPLTSTYLWLQYQKKMVKRELKWKMIAGLDKDELVLLKFTEKDKKTKLRWKHSKEFEYQHEMYDIVETLVMGDSTYYWCWWDNIETQLNKQLASLVGYSLSKDVQHNKKINELVFYLKTLYCQDIYKLNLEKSKLAFAIKTKAFFELNHRQTQAHLSINPPPPRHNFFC